MALTEAQKLANKAAQRVRDRAHNARYRALCRELDGVDTLPEVVQAQETAQAADEAWQAEIDRVNARKSALQAQIATLQAQIDALHDNPVRENLARKRREAHDALHRLKRTIAGAVEQRYPDMEGVARFSAPAWKPPADVLAAMDAARNDPESVLTKPARKTRQKA